MQITEPSLGFAVLEAPPSPLLGGAIILYAEMLIIGRFENVEVELCANSPISATESQSLAVFHAISRLSRVAKVKLLRNGELCESFDRTTFEIERSEIFESQSTTLDSPANLLNCEPDDVLNLVRFDVKTTETAVKHLDRKKWNRVLCLHANAVAHPSLEEQTMSKGSVDEWALGLREALDSESGVSLLIIGEGADILAEKINRPDRLIPPVGDLAVELACVQLADGFLGMSSGPAAIAIFSATPYTVFKHPEHHAADMKSLLTNGRYPFSLPSQRVVQTYPGRSEVFAAVLGFIAEWGDQ